MLRVGLIGAGWIGRVHLANLARMPGVEVAGVCDIDAARAEDAAAEAHAASYTDWRALVERERPDAVLVCTPPSEHRAPALAALERGAGVYLEKPIAHTLADAQAICAAAERGGVVAVGYQYRAIDWLDEVRELLDGQAVGLMSGVSLGCTSPRPWLADPAHGGGHVLERASHQVDLMRLLAGEVERVLATGARAALGDGVPDGSDDVVALTLRFGSGALGTIALGWTGPDLPRTRRVDVVASEALLQLGLEPDFALAGVCRGRAVALRCERHPLARGVERFLDAVRAGNPSAVACAPRAATGTLAVAIACEHARDNGGVAAV